MVLLSISCSSGEKRGAYKPFFDLNGYFQDEAIRLSQLAGPFEKTVLVDGEEEEKTLDSLDWASEFRVFTASDINLPAWFDKYAIDSVLVEGTLTDLKYIAIDTSLKTREIQITFDNGNPSWVSVKRESNSPLASTLQELEYIPASGYRLSSSQTLRLSEEKVVEVEVSW